MGLDPASLSLIAITFVAAVVNGALGYGFSSITMPVGLLFYSNRLLNPAMVLVEVAINLVVLISSRASIPAVRRKVLPVICGVVPAVILGSVLLTRVNPAWVKLGTYAVLLPLIFIQILGVRRPLHTESWVGGGFGAGIGLLYSMTTISGPPLAVMFNNEGLVKQEFRAAIASIRLVESVVTAVAYAQLGLFARENSDIALLIAPGLLIGMPIGMLLIKRVPADAFRRVCMSFDAWLVAFGLSRTLSDLGLLPRPYLLLGAVVALDVGIFIRRVARRS